MWNHLYQMWRSVLVAGPTPEPLLDETPREALHEELRRLLEERENLQKTASSYQEFGFDEPAGRVRRRLLVVDRRIGGIRLHLQRRTAVTGR
jgi:hypothetical protein